MNVNCKSQSRDSPAISCAAKARMSTVSSSGGVETVTGAEETRWRKRGLSLGMVVEKTSTKF